MCADLYTFRPRERAPLPEVVASWSLSTRVQAPLQVEDTVTAARLKQGKPASRGWQQRQPLAQLPAGAPCLQSSWPPPSRSAPGWSSNGPEQLRCQPTAASTTFTQAAPAMHRTPMPVPAGTGHAAEPGRQNYNQQNSSATRQQACCQTARSGPQQQILQKADPTTSADCSNPPPCTGLTPLVPQSWHALRSAQGSAGLQQKLQLLDPGTDQQPALAPLPAAGKLGASRTSVLAVSASKSVPAAAACRVSSKWQQPAAGDRPCASGGTNLATTAIPCSATAAGKVTGQHKPATKRRKPVQHGPAASTVPVAAAAPARPVATSQAAKQEPAGNVLPKAAPRQPLACIEDVPLAKRRRMAPVKHAAQGLPGGGDHLPDIRMQSQGSNVTGRECQEACSGSLQGQAHPQSCDQPPLRSGQAGSGEAKRSRKIANPLPQLPAQLLFNENVRDGCQPEAQHQLAVALAAIKACAVTLLLADSHTKCHFFSTVVGLSRAQQQAIVKAAAAEVKAAKTAAHSGQASRGKHSPDQPSAGQESGSGSGNGSAPQAGQARLGIRQAAQDSGVLVALAVQPVCQPDSTAAARSAAGCMYVVPLAEWPAWPGGGAGAQTATAGRQLLTRLLADATLTIYTFDLQGLLRRVLGARLAVPRLAGERLVDARLAAWLAEPQLVQKQERQLEAYSLPDLLQRYGLAQAVQSEEHAAGSAGSDYGESSLRPLQALQRQLADTVALAQAASGCLAGTLAPRAAARQMELELRISSLLAEMEIVGMGFDGDVLAAHETRLRGRLAALEAQAARLAGRPFNLTSATQLAAVLYDQLRLPLPSTAGRSAAKTHGSTDEAALRALVPRHALPGLVLQHRCIANLLTKWLDSGWVAHAAAERRVRCSWNQTATVTGRLSCCNPNLQAVTKYQVPLAPCGQAAQQQPQQEELNIRDAFVAPEGWVLLSADYSQIELRILAHLSGDAALQRILCQAGPAGDAFAGIAAAWLGQTQPGGVGDAERQQAKRVTYGIIYGLTAWGLARELRVALPAAQHLIDSFLAYFCGVKAYVERTKLVAQVTGYVTTLAGRRRPIATSSTSDKRDAGVADRKAVNSSIQGSAADLIKAAMVAWADWREGHLLPALAPASGVPNWPMRLVAQIHDELLFEVDTRRCSLDRVASAVHTIMTGAADLSVPLMVNMRQGRSWGSMSPLPACM